MRNQEGTFSYYISYPKMCIFVSTFWPAQLWSRFTIRRKAKINQNKLVSKQINRNIFNIFARLVRNYFMNSKEPLYFKLLVANYVLRKIHKVIFFGLCSKMQIIPIRNLNIEKVVLQFLWFFRLKCWFKGQIISRIHLSLPNAYK